LRNVDVGNIINASSTDGLVVITQTQPISVLFTLPQAQLPEVAARLREGRTLAVDLFDSTDATRVGQGVLASVDNQIDVATGTVKLKARFENEDESLFPNQFVNVHLRVDTVESLLIPSEAVQQGSIGAFVYVVDQENKVRIQAIKTGRVTDGVTAVASGLQAGQRVVTEGVDRLREGGQVEVMPDSASAADIPSIPATGLQQQDRSAGARGGQGKASGTDANARRPKREHAAGGQQAAGGAGQKNAAGDAAEAK
jgi:multidrug efflux system membrane fusion protein